jgi:glycine cleavage system H protein
MSFFCCTNHEKRGENMSEIKQGLLYSKDHEWVERTGSGAARIGISDFAQCELGDIVFVELPEVGKSFRAGQSMGTIESVKAVSDLMCPVSGTITKVNEVLLEQPELVNEEPFNGGWIVEMELGEESPNDLEQLLDGEKYQIYLDQQS